MWPEEPDRKGDHSTDDNQYRVGSYQQCCKAIKKSAGSHFRVTAIQYQIAEPGIEAASTASNRSSG